MPAVGPHSMVMVEMACKDMVKNIHIYIYVLNQLMKPTSVKCLRLLLGSNNSNRKEWNFFGSFLVHYFWAIVILTKKIIVAIFFESILWSRIEAKPVAELVTLIQSSFLENSPLSHVKWSFHTLKHNFCLMVWTGKYYSIFA